MKCIIEVMATNTETGHIVVNQHSVEVNCPTIIDEDNLYNKLKESTYFKPYKIGNILISRSLLVISEKVGN